MKRRLAVLLTVAASVSGLGTMTVANAQTTEFISNSDITSRTTSGGIEITTPQVLGITDKVITTDKGTITITDSGTIITEGDTRYNPLTGNFDVENYQFEKIFDIEGYGEVKYGYGGKFNKDATFVQDGVAYSVNNGDIYTRWSAKTIDEVNKLNLLPVLSFMEIDDKWVLINGTKIIYNRYSNTRAVDEIVSWNNSTLRLEEETLLRNENRDLILPSGTLLIFIDAKAQYINDKIPQKTIINYPNGEVEYLGEEMKIVNTNLSVGIQNMNGDNRSAEFRTYVLNQEEEVKPPVDEEKPDNGNGSEVKPPITETEDDDYEWLKQQLDTSKRYSYTVTSTIDITKGKEKITLTKGDKIILPKSTKSILKDLPKNTLIIKNSKRVVLSEGYVIDRKVEFKETKEFYVAYKLDICGKLLDIVFKLR